MNWKRRIDTIVAVVSVALIVSGGLLYYFASGFQLIGPIIVIIGFVLMALTALGGKEGEKKQPGTVTPGPQPVGVGGGGERSWADDLSLNRLVALSSRAAKKDSCRLA